MAQTKGDMNRPRDIESDIARTRARMDQTLDELGERLQPGNLMDEATQWVREKVWGPVGPAAREVGHRAYRGFTDHPLTAAAAASALLLLVYQMKKTNTARPPRPPRRRGEPRVGEEVGAYDSLIQEGSEMNESFQSRSDEAAEQVSESLARGSGKAREWTRRAREGVSELGHRLSEQMSSDTVRDMRHRARHRYEQGRRSASQGFGHYPLIFGAVALGCGLLLGMSLPASRPERRMMGSTARRARRRARAVGQDLMDRTRHAASEAAEAAREAAQREGLTPDQLRERATRVAEEAGRAAEHELAPEQSVGEPPRPEDRR